MQDEGKIGLTGFGLLLVLLLEREVLGQANVAPAADALEVVASVVDQAAVGGHQALLIDVRALARPSSLGGDEHEGNLDLRFNAALGANGGHAEHEQLERTGVEGDRPWWRRREAGNHSRSHDGVLRDEVRADEREDGRRRRLVRRRTRKVVLFGTPRRARVAASTALTAASSAPAAVPFALAAGRARAASLVRAVERGRALAAHQLGRDARVHGM